MIFHNDWSILEEGKVIVLEEGLKDGLEFNGVAMKDMNFQPLYYFGSRNRLKSIYPSTQFVWASCMIEFH